MGCDFKPGDEVVCVDAGPGWDGSASPLTEGCVYTVKGLFELYGDIGVLLVEVCPPDPFIDFRPDRFRKVERRNDKLNLTEWLAQPTGYDEEQANPAPSPPAKKRERA